MSNKMNNCPLCKNEVKLDELLKNTKYFVNNDFAIFESTLISDNSPVNVENQSQCHFKKGEAVTFSTYCPHQCGVNIYGIFQNQKDDKKNQKLLSDSVFKEWNKMNSSPNKDHCPSCHGLMYYDEDEFIYPIERLSIDDFESTVNFRASCDSGGCGCGFSIVFKSNRKDAKNFGKKLWNKIY